MLASMLTRYPLSNETSKLQKMCEDLDYGIKYIYDMLLCDPSRYSQGKCGKARAVEWLA